MKIKKQPALKFFVASARLGVTLLFVSLMFGQGPGGGRPQITGVPTDWTSKFVVYSNENSPSDRALQDPRFWLQYLRRHGKPFQSNSPSSPGVVRDQDARNVPQFDPGNCNGPHCQPAPQVDWSVSLGGSVAEDMFPAKFTFDVNAAPNCANDFVVFPINKNAGGSQANLIGFNNLYTNPSGNGFCTGLTAPSVKWSYRIGTKMVRTSPVLSLNGGKVAFVDSDSPANFYVLTPGTASEGTSATAPVIPGNPGPPASNAVLVTISLTGGAASTRSSPFVDYSNDTAYVGTDNGKLFKITGVFNSTPTLVTTGGWPVTISGAGKFTGPVLDFSTQKIFVGDDQGFLYMVDVHGATPAAPVTLNVSKTGGSQGALLDPPLVDSTNGSVFVFSGDDATSSVAVQADASLAEQARIRVGKKSGTFLHAGTFDDRYIRLGPASGFLYVVGKQSTTNGFTNDNDKPTLYRIGFIGTTLNCLAVGSACTALTGALEISNNTGGEGSPLTELKNGMTDRLFVGITKGTNNVGLCPFGGGCVENFDITLLMPTTTAAPAVSEAGGTSGIVVDNVSTAAEASSIYFGPLSATLAVKLTQAGLQ